MKASIKLIGLAVVLLLASCANSSTSGDDDSVTTTSDLGSDTPVSSLEAQWNVFQWHTLANGASSYELELVVKGQKRVVSRGVDFISGRIVPTGSNSVPASAISAYYVIAPDDKDFIFYATPRANTVQVYRIDSTPKTGSSRVFGKPRLLTTIAL
ncbi:MAG: hypothetical protein NWT08_07860 [Akkermansiaceae bacterium]|jgi:hypothetical protein|nr:hypothetical protein [Akkermansiaceae bacterium]MDP4721416.1 hypothetical protein [Akkermansiaceae bacterium]MDP4779055.1 hypothetical protein [Akkermansiaceae bacterium]MDP4846838.1 hypothetical protein [Akkermansiaceae bacterium]MDP4995792.1 hypothetical protein [Akkermansiaceae bacterium]